MTRTNPASSRTFAATLTLRPRTSRQLTAALVAAHAAAGLAVLAGVANTAYAVAGCAVLAVSAALGYRRYVMGLGRGVVKAATWHADGSWRLECTAGAAIGARLLPGTVVLPRLVLLHFRTDNGARRFMVLCRDSLSPALLRRLRARLRVSGLTLPASTGLEET